MRFKGEPPDLESHFGGKEIESCKLASPEVLLQLRLLLYVVQFGMYVLQFGVYVDEVLQYCEILRLHIDWQRYSDALLNANLLLKSLNLEVEELVEIQRLASRPRWVDNLHVGEDWC